MYKNIYHKYIMPKWLIFVLSILVLMLTQLGTDIYLPSMPAMVSGLNTNAVLIKLSNTTMIMGLGLSQLIYGPLADSYGRKPTILWGLSIFITGSMITVLVKQVDFLLAGRLIQGLGLGFGLSMSSVVASDLYQGHHCHQALSIISIVYAIMPVCAPVLGGGLQAYMGWQANLWLLLILGLAAFVALKIAFPETLKPSHQVPFSPPTIIKNYQSCLANDVFRANLVIASLFYAGEVSYIIQLPLIAQWQFSVKAIFTGWLVAFTAVSIVIGSSLSAYLLKYIRPEAIITTGTVCAVSAVILWFLFIISGHYNLAAFIGPMALFMLGSGLSFPNCIGNCFRLFPSKAGIVSALSIGTLTFLGGLLTIVVAKIPTDIDYAFPLFMLFICTLMTKYTLSIIKSPKRSIN